METIMQYIPLAVSAILLAALILTVITNIITQVVKKITWDKIPTNILAVLVAMAVTLLAFFAVCQIMGWAVTWYMVAGAVALGLFVSYAAVLPPDHRHGGGGGPSGGLPFGKADDHAGLQGIHGTPVSGDGLANHHKAGVVRRLHGLGNERGNGVLDLLHFLRLQVFAGGAENGGHAVPFGDDILPVVVRVNLRPALLAVAAESNGFRRALDDLHHENTVVIAGAGGEIFLANLKSSHLVNPPDRVWFVRAVRPCLTSVIIYLRKYKRKR